MMKIIGISVVAFIVGLFVIGGVIRVSLNSGSAQEQTNTVLEDIRNQVATDAVKQYEIANRQGDKMQICVQAGFVSAAYLQAQNESSYRNWKDIQEMDCKRAGLSQF